MSIEPKPLDQQISEAYQSASQTETLARQLEARISQIDGAKRHLPARRYGQPVDLAQIKSNLTLSSLIAADSAELAHFIGLDPGIHHRIQRRRKPHLAAESLKLKMNSCASRPLRNTVTITSDVASAPGLVGGSAHEVAAHPLLTWLRLEPRDYSRSLDQLLVQRDRYLQIEPGHSGPAPGFIEWVWQTEVPQLLQ